jgi:hypothetical protein
MSVLWPYYKNRLCQLLWHGYDHIIKTGYFSCYDILWHGYDHIITCCVSRKWSYDLTVNKAIIIWLLSRLLTYTSHILCVYVYFLCREGVYCIPHCTYACVPNRSVTDPLPQVCSQWTPLSYSSPSCWSTCGKIACFIYQFLAPFFQ